jgi:hypothetical protein
MSLYPTTKEIAAELRELADALETVGDVQGFYAARFSMQTNEYRPWALVVDALAGRGVIEGPSKYGAQSFVNDPRGSHPLTVPPDLCIDISWMTGVVEEVAK